MVIQIAERHACAWAGMNIQMKKMKVAASQLRVHQDGDNSDDPERSFIRYPKIVRCVIVPFVLAVEEVTSLCL
jgi:hypothetical protein